MADPDDSFVTIALQPVLSAQVGYQRNRASALQVCCVANSTRKPVIRPPTLGSPPRDRCGLVNFGPARIAPCARRESTADAPKRGRPEPSRLRRPNSSHRSPRNDESGSCPARIQHARPRGAGEIGTAPSAGRGFEETTHKELRFRDLVRKRRMRSKSCPMQPVMHSCGRSVLLHVNADSERSA